MIIAQISTIVLTVLLGLAVGSFLNVVIYRLPNDMSLVKPASHCPKCNEPIRWYDNIPVLSYIILRGKCRHCKEPISFRYPFVEILNTVLWFLCLMLFTNFIFPDNPLNWLRFVFSCLVCSTLLCIFFCDYDHMEIPEVFQGILLVCGLVLLLDGVNAENIMLKVFGALGAAALFLLVNLIYKLIKKRDGIGFGDVELVFCAGLILGGYKMIFALIVSCLVGGVALIIIAAIKKEKGKEYPFAVLLVAGILLALFVGDYVVNWYMGLLG